MASLSEVAAGIAATVKAATGLRTYEFVPEDLNPPALMLVLSDVERASFKLGQMQVRIDAVLFTQSASDRAGQAKQSEYASWDTVRSVWLALDTNGDLGLVDGDGEPDTDAKVLRYRPLGIEEVAAYSYYGGVFEILAITKGVQ
jgi:hypothetical protein